MPNKAVALSAVSVYGKFSSSSPIIGTIAKGAEVTIYDTASHGKWVSLSADSMVWAPMYDASGKAIFRLETDKPAVEVKETTASDLSSGSKNTNSGYYYIGTDWNDGKAVNQVGTGLPTFDTAVRGYDTLSNKDKYKIYDSNGNKVYPPTVNNTKSNTRLLSETNTTSETIEIEDESEIDWSKLYALSDDVASDYTSSIASLTVKNIKGVMGLPYQWSPLQDPRITNGSKTSVGDKNGIGRTYGDKILSKVPLLLITPGTPEFLGNYSESQQKSILGKMLQVIDDPSAESGLKAIITRDGKYYSLKFDYVSYYNCVNPMCRTGAYFLGIQDTVVNGKELKYHNQYTDNRDELDKFLGTYNGCIPFYVNSETSIQDSFGNDTTQSSLADKINGYSSMANELNYILGSSKAGALYDDLGAELSGTVEGLGNMVNSMLGGTNLITSISQNLSSVLAGGKMIFPEIWSDSSFSRSYDVTVKLVTPDNDKLSWYLNIWVPLAHLMALCLPRQVDANGYISPFLVRAFYKGLFNVDMGIITSMNVQKGGDGQWTKDGLPTSIEVSFTIKDLYNYMSLSDDPSIKNNLMNNITLLDYIGNTCGININETDIMRNLEMYLMVSGVGTVQDRLINDSVGALDQWFTNKVAKVFGFFN